jgi:ElaA protein
LITWQTIAFDDLSNHLLYAILQLRQEVFIVEQDCVYLDLDGLDQKSVHILCWEGETLLAVLRCLPPGLSYTQSSLGRIVTAAAARSRSLGRELVERGISHNLQQWPESDIRIGAQTYLEKFYTSLGFITDGESYLEDGIQHIHMNLPH